ncbi:MAG: S-layer homology domain-containing protein [Clostridia bacterium]|nr:S-layer homology domain-containing protein [Clostridia bacterium]
MKRIICILLILTMLLPLTLSAAPAGLGLYKVTASMLNVRSGPSSSYSAIGALYSGSNVEVLEISNGWGRINYNGRTGWISLSYAVHTGSKQYSVSAGGLAMIKSLEGYYKFKYWDYSQWSIGYGTRCEEHEYPNGITEPEASALLVKVLANYEAYVDSFLGVNGIEVSQQQYDALVSFTYNLGNVWVSSSDFKLRTILLNGIVGYSEQEIRDAFGQFVYAGGQVVNGLIYRRKVEADMFMKGTITTPVAGFDDVRSNAWYADEVSFCVDKGYMKGMSSTVFSPNSNVTREQFVLILANIAGADTNVYKNISSGMSDVPTGQWYSGAVTWAVQSGFVSGVSEGVFGRGQAIQRAALARLLYLYAEQNGMDVMGRAELSEFGDYDIISLKSSAWMVAPLCWAVDKGIISGVERNGVTYLDPRASATRAQTARMLMQFSELE